MRKTLNRPSQYVWWWITATLTATASLSAPFLIDGITYTKVSIALVMTSCILPFILLQLYKSISTKLAWVFISLFFLINLYLLYMNSNSYRSVFGAPGRNNGLLSGIVCFYFFLIGLYAKKFCTILDVYKSISIVSVFTSFCVLVMTNFDIGKKSVFASNNFLSSSFAENSNLLAPLICAGFVSTIVCYRETKNYLFTFFLIPLAFVAVQLSVIQVYLNLILSLSILGFVTSKRNFRTVWLPVIVFAGYFLGVFLALQGFFDRDPSIKERTDILRIAGNLSSEFTFLPVNIDGLSDFTRNFVSFGGAQFLDDFHNVFLQTFFSLGSVIGFLFLVLAVTPYLTVELPYREKLQFLSVYTSLLISLLIGISSPNFIYIYFILLGYSLASLFKGSQPLSFKQFDRTPIVWGLAAVLVFTPIYVQTGDLKTRFEISDKVSKANTTSMFTESSFKELVRLLNEIEDAGYRNRMALNFYSIGECKYGDLVYELMKNTNPYEARLRGLGPVKNGCIQA